MLAKIKHDEDFFRRPIDPNTQWYKLSRTKVDYRQIIFDRINRERPGLSDRLRSEPPILTSDFRGTSENNKLRISIPPNNVYNNGEFVVENYQKLPSGYENRYSDAVRETKDGKLFEPNTFWEDDVSYSLKYESSICWWFDLCLQPEEYVLLEDTTGLRGTIKGRNSLPTEYWNYSPSRDLATNTFIHFASMQNNPQSFIRKTSYVTAPYMPYVEQNIIFMPPISRKSFRRNDPNDRRGITATIYGVGDLGELFDGAGSRSEIDRKERQKIFNDFFKALDAADWLSADKFADNLIEITDSTGWAPYIGYGDMSLFIQRMNIPSEYIMTHALTNYQDEILTNAFAVNQLNNRIIDAAYQMQKKSIGNKELEIVDRFIATEDGYEENTRFSDTYEYLIQDVLKVRQAVANHIMMGGTSESATKILNRSRSTIEAIDLLESSMVQAGINAELSNLNKI